MPVPVLPFLIGLARVSDPGVRVWGGKAERAESVDWAVMFRERGTGGNETGLALTTPWSFPLTRGELGALADAIAGELLKAPAAAVGDFSFDLSLPGSLSRRGELCDLVSAGGSGTGTLADFGERAVLIARDG